jgi:hypothetical protein
MLKPFFARTNKTCLKSKSIRILPMPKGVKWASPVSDKQSTLLDKAH